MSKLEIGRSARTLAIPGVVIMLVSLALFLYLVRSPAEMTRLRNSLIAEQGVEADFRWLPPHHPAEFAEEPLATPESFSRLPVIVETQKEASELSRALNIARHLTDGGRGSGDAVQSDTYTTYFAITKDNQGYCSDFSQVFNALSHASGIPVREWGMSFDGFSGAGHAFSEIFDRQLGKWIFMDSYYSFYVVDQETGVPYSVLELVAAIKSKESALAGGVVPINDASFAFKTPEKAIQYYARGVGQFYLWFGNDVFSYDSNSMVRFFGRLSRSAEQTAAILLQVHPRIRIVPTGSDEWIDRLFAARTLFLTALLLGIVGMVLVCAWYFRRPKASD